MSNFWTTEKLKLLKDYLQAGLSYKQIADKLTTTYDAVGNAVKRYSLQEYRIVKPAVQKFVQNIPLEELNDDNFEELKEEAKLRWNIQKSKLPALKTGAYETAVIIGDVHIPHQDEPSLKAMLQCLGDLKPTRMVVNGDFLDYGVISHWTENKRRTLELQRLKNDYIIGNSLLDEIDIRLPKNCQKDFLKGNHEVWVDDLLEKMPALEGLIEPEPLLNLKERGYKVTEYNDFIHIGKLSVTHGIYATGNSVKKHLDELKVNVLFGHTHTIASMLSSSPAREIAFSGYNHGCLCNLSPDYMRGRPHGWSHGFAIVHIYPNEYFEVHLIRIIDGKFIWNGKVYDGNK